VALALAHWQCGYEFKLWHWWGGYHHSLPTYVRGGNTTMSSYGDLRIPWKKEHANCYYRVYLLMEALRMEFAIQVHEAYIVEPFPIDASFTTEVTLLHSSSSSSLYIICNPIAITLFNERKKKKKP